MSLFIRVADEPDSEYWASHDCSLLSGDTETLSGECPVHPETSRLGGSISY